MILRGGYQNDMLNFRWSCFEQDMIFSDDHSASMTISPNYIWYAKLSCFLPEKIFSGSSGTADTTDYGLIKN